MPLKICKVEGFKWVCKWFQDTLPFPPGIAVKDSLAKHLEELTEDRDIPSQRELCDAILCFAEMQRLDQNYQDAATLCEVVLLALRGDEPVDITLLMQTLVCWIRSLDGAKQHDKANSIAGLLPFITRN